MALAEIAMIVAGAKKAVNFVEAVAKAGGDIQQYSQKIEQAFNYFDDIKEKQLKATKGDYLSRNSPEAQALSEINAEFEIEQLEEKLRVLIQWNMTPQHYVRMMRKRKKIRAERLAIAKRKAENRRLMIDGLFICFCLGAATVIIGYSISLIIGARA